MNKFILLMALLFIAIISISIVVFQTSDRHLDLQIKEHDKAIIEDLSAVPVNQ